MLKYAAVTYFAICALGAIGYIANIITMLNHIHDPIVTLEVLRILGILVVPLGVILGFI